MKIMKPLLGAMICASMLIPSQSALAATPTYNANNQPLSFVNNSRTDDFEILDGARTSSQPVRYANVITVSGTRIDALVSVVNLFNQESASGLSDSKLDRIDKYGSEPALEAKIRSSVEDGIESYLVFDIAFVKSGSTVPVKLQNIVVSVADVDNNQYVEFSGLTSYLLSNGRVANTLDAYTGSASLTLIGGSTVSATIPDGSVRFFAAGDSDDHNSEHLVVEAKFAELTTLRTKLGVYESGSASMDLSFRTFSFTSAPAPVTVVQPSFDISYDANEGTGSAPSTTSASGAQSVAANGGPSPLTRDGFTFRGWNTRADGTGVTYTAGASIIPIANTTLYALWRADSELANTGLESDALLVGATAIGAGALLMAIRTSRRAPKHRA